MSPSNNSAAQPSLLRRALILAVLVVAVVGLMKYFGLFGLLSFETLARNREWLLAEVASLGVAAPLIFILIYAGAVAVSLPGALFLTLAGGFLFGTWLGTLYVVIGATLGATIIFLIAKTALGDALRSRAGPFVKKLEAGFREDALSYLLVLRLVPLFPFWLVNLVPAFLGVKLRAFVIGTFVGIIPGSLVYASVGSGLGAIFESGGTPDLKIILQPRVLLPIVGLAVLAMVPVVYKKLRRPPAAATAGVVPPVEPEPKGGSHG